MVAALTLLVVGALALVNAISGEPDTPDPSPAASSSGGGVGRDTASRSPDEPASATLPLVIRVTGPATAVVVKVADTGEILTQGKLSTGESRKYEETPLNVFAANGGALQVVIYGKQQPAKPAGQRGQWFVAAQR